MGKKRGPGVFEWVIEAGFKVCAVSFDEVGVEEDFFIVAGEVGIGEDTSKGVVPVVWIIFKPDPLAFNEFCDVVGDEETLWVDWLSFSRVQFWRIDADEPDLVAVFNDECVAVYYPCDLVPVGV